MVMSYGYWDKQACFKSWGGPQAKKTSRRWMMKPEVQSLSVPNVSGKIAERELRTMI